MEFNTILSGQQHIAEIRSKETIIRNEQDALDIIGNAPSDYIVLYEENFTKDFFDLSTRKLGDVLQKFTNYRIKLAIVGNFATYPGETLKDFIYESNKHGEYLFVPSLDEVIRRWKK